MNKESTARVIDIFDCASYNAGYLEGYEQCKAEYAQRVRETREAKYAERRRRLYSLKKRMVGVFFLIFTILVVHFLDGDTTIALLTIPISLMLIFNSSDMKER